MQVIKPLSKISSEFLNSCLWKLLVLLDNLEQVTTRTIFKDDPEVIPRFIPIVELENVAIL